MPKTIVMHGVGRSFQEDLWKSFERKTNPFHRWRNPKIWGVAAMVLVGFFYFGKQYVAGKEYERKEVLLQQAQELFSEARARSVRDSVIYETEELIIYTTRNR